MRLTISIPRSSRAGNRNRCASWNGSDASVERRLTTAKHPLFLQHRCSRKWNEKCFKVLLSLFLFHLHLAIYLPIVASYLPRFSVFELLRVTGRIRM